MVNTLTARGRRTCSYLLPVINHYLLYFGLARCQRAEGLYRVPTHPFWHRNGGVFWPKITTVSVLSHAFKPRFRKCMFRGCACVHT